MRLENRELDAGSGRARRREIREDWIVLYLCVLGVQGGEGEKEDGHMPKHHDYESFIVDHIASM